MKIKALLVFTIVMIFMGQLMAADSNSSQRQNKFSKAEKRQVTKIKPAPAKAAIADLYRFEHITGGMGMHAKGFMQIGILNSHETLTGFAEVEIHRAISDNPNAKNKKVRHTRSIVIPPKTMYYTLFYRRDDKQNHYPTGYWVKIRTSSDYLLPSVTNHMFNSSEEFWPVSQSYLPNDFAVFSIKPYKRIK